MGLNLSLQVFEKQPNVSLEMFLDELMPLLSIQITKKKEHCPFDFILEKVYFDFAGQFLAVATKGNFVLIIDQSQTIITYHRPTSLKA